MAYTTINKSSDYFDTKTYTQSGSNNNGNTQTLTMDNVGWVWIKNRDYTNGHCLFDIVRGGDKLLASNSTGLAETAGGGITFGASSTTIGADTGGYGFNNRVGDDYVGWHWRTDGTSGSSNTDGTITSTVSANTTSGFSISTYTGTGSNATIGHGLGVKPSVVLVKNVSSTEHWVMYHHKSHATPEDNYLRLNSTNAVADFDMWNDTAPTNQVFSISSNGSVGASGDTYVAYCFAEKQGFSKFGSYVGNGNANGSFIYTGFAPAFIITKITSGVDSWFMYDNKRSPFNVRGKYLVADGTGTDSNADAYDFLSNGFKVKSTATSFNGNGSTYIYMAFAKAPLVGSNNVPCNAR